MSCHVQMTALRPHNMLAFQVDELKDREETIAQGLHRASTCRHLLTLRQCEPPPDVPGNTILDDTLILLCHKHLYYAQFDLTALSDGHE